MGSPVFVVEHMDDEFFPWSQLEYKRIAENIYPSKLMLTNFSFSLPEDWDEDTRRNVIIHRESITDLYIPICKVCLMDSESATLLQPADARNFDYFLLGGILGNVDEFDFDRTRILREHGFPTRNLGSIQMSTDTAAICTKMVAQDGIPFDTIPFVDRPEITINDSERIIMNFRYIRNENGSPIMAPGVLDLIKTVDFDLDLME